MPEEMNNAEFYSMIKEGDAAWDKADYKAALEIYEKAAKIAPQKELSMLNERIADTYLYMDDYVNAEKYAEEAVRLDDKNALAYNVIGMTKAHGKDYEGAIKLYTSALQFMQDPEFYSNRAECYSYLGKYEQALNDYTKAVGLDESNPYFLLGRAKVYLASNLKDKALADLRKALSINPGDAEARELLEKLTGMKLSGEDLRAGLTLFKFIEFPKDDFASVADMAELKEVLKSAIIYPFKKPDLAKKYGIDAGGGVLLYGPPGCGKTFIAKAIAGEAKVNLLEGKIPDIMEFWVQSSGGSIHNLFEMARSVRPSILFMDEADALGGFREDMTSSTLRLIVNSLLIELDSSADNKDVLIIAATNSPWLMDPALIRSGRFKAHIYVPPPTPNGRKELFKFYLANKPIAEIDYDKLSSITEYYSCADIVEVCEAAAKIPWQEALNTGKERPITNEDLLRVISQIKPTIPSWYESAQAHVQEYRNEYPELFKDVRDYYDKKKGIILI